MATRGNRQHAVAVPGEANTAPETIEGAEMGEGLDLDAIGDDGAAVQASGDPEGGETDEAQQADTESDIEAAIAAGQSGSTHKIEKPKPVAPRAVLPRPDPSRPASAGVNQRPTMTYAEAMEAKESGTLQRSVLTEKGWVAVDKAPPAENKR